MIRGRGNEKRGEEERGKRRRDRLAILIDKKRSLSDSHFVRKKKEKKIKSIPESLSHEEKTKKKEKLKKRKKSSKTKI